MKVTIDVPGLIQYLLLGWDVPDDDMTVIGHSRVAYLSEQDPGHALLPAARWHDAAYTAGASIQCGPDAWPRWKVDAHFLKMMLDIAQDNLELQKEACTLFVAVCMYGARMYEGPARRWSEAVLSDVRARLVTIPLQDGTNLNPASLWHDPYVVAA